MALIHTLWCLHVVSSNLPYMADSQKLLSLHVVPIIHNSSQNHVNVNIIGPNWMFGKAEHEL